MRRMTSETILGGHFRRMWLMATIAGFFVTMIGMATAAIDLKMLTGGGLHRRINLGVTTQTSRLGLCHFAEIKFKGSVGIMTADAPLDLVMAVLFRGMTLSALGDHPILFGRMRLMTGDAIDFSLVRLPLTVNFGRNLFMAGRTVGRINLSGKSDIGWLVRRMTAQTIRVGHALGMRLVTGQAVVELTMLLMTLPTVYRRMFGGIKLHEPADHRMAGNADRLHLLATFQIHLKWCMGVMAGHARLRRIMDLLQSRMTGTAGQNGFLTVGLVLRMTGGTTGLGLMGRPLLLDLPRLVAVAGGTEAPRNIERIFEGRRLMRRVAAQAVSVGHLLGMRLVAIQTGQMLTMGLVTLFAIECAVLTGNRLQFGPDRAMTGEASRFNRIERIQVDFQGTVGGMTLGTAANGKMRIVRWCMTGGAGNFSGDPGLGMFYMAFGATNPGMPPMTVGTADFGLMRATALVDIGDLGRMAGRAQRRRRGTREISLGRLMGRMATQAIGVSHIRRVRVMAVETGHGLAMLRMTLVTPHLRMNAGEFGGLLSGACMTGNTSRTDVAQGGQILNEWCMGVMTGATIGHGEMSIFSYIVAVSTGRNLAMLLVASGTANFFMGLASLGQKCRWPLVAGATQCR